MKKLIEKIILSKHFNKILYIIFGSMVFYALYSTTLPTKSFDYKLLNRLTQRGEDLKESWQSTAALRDDYVKRIERLEKELILIQHQADENCSKMRSEFSEINVPSIWVQRCYEKKNSSSGSKIRLIIKTND